MARERSNPVAGYDYRETVTTGGSGFGIMAMLAGAERSFLPRAHVLERLHAILAFLERADRHHGVFPHFLNGTTGATIPFSAKDDGGDLVETAFLMMGLLCARQFFADAGAREAELRTKIDRLWQAVEWDWHTRGRDTLYWHWSPRHGWAMNHAIAGWNECLIAYVLAAASPTHAIAPEVYHRGWTDSPTFRNGENYYGIDAAARAGLWRPAVLFALLLPRARPARFARPLRRLLGAEPGAYADQSRALHREPWTALPATAPIAGGSPPATAMPATPPSARGTTVA